MKGKLILVVGVPGAGKSTLIRYAHEMFPELGAPLSWTTRPMRPGELEGETYHFATDEEFTQGVAEGKFLEWVTIDNGRRYGTLKADVVPALEAGEYLLDEIEPIGARNLRALLTDLVVTVFITAGSWESMAQRIRTRAPMTDEEFGKRKERYERELAFEKEADYVITNADGKLEEAKAAFQSVIAKIIENSGR